MVYDVRVLLVDDSRLELEKSYSQGIEGMGFNQADGRGTAPHALTLLKRQRISFSCYRLQYAQRWTAESFRVYSIQIHRQLYSNHQWSPLSQLTSPKMAISKQTARKNALCVNRSNRNEVKALV